MQLVLHHSWPKVELVDRHCMLYLWEAFFRNLDSIDKDKPCIQYPPKNPQVTLHGKMDKTAKAYSLSNLKSYS